MDITMPPELERETIAKEIPALNITPRETPPTREITAPKTTAQETTSQGTTVRQTNAPGTTSLCNTCASLDLTFADFVKYQDRRRNLLERTLKDFKTSGNCLLCSLIVYAVENTRPEWQGQQTQADENVVCKVRLQRYPYPTSKPFNVINITTNFPFHGPSYGMQLYPVGSSKSPNMLMGRAVDKEGIPFPLVRSWIQECCESHIGTCEISDGSEFEQIASEFLVIDVQNSCIVRIFGSFRYLALSYVWGRCKSIQLTPGNKEALATPGGLAAIFDELPRVIQDAIELTKRLGEKYIWIDSLCIVQNDDEVKAKLISKMNLVYKHAFLTLFAATGEDANAGLPGLQPDSRRPLQATASIGPGLGLVYPLSHASLGMSAWGGRGWTFQEYYFARRRLIFHNGILYFRCCKSSWREDLTLETFGVDIDQFDLSKGFKAQQEIWEPPGGIQDLFGSHRAYSTCLQAYMSRNLSFDSDALKAFAGIMNFITADLGLTMVQGLLEAFLCEDMFWQAETFMERRDLFPSWSWAGWKGRMWMPQTTPEVHFLSQFIAWYVWNTELGSYQLLSTGATFEAIEDFDLDMSDPASSALQALRDLVILRQAAKASKEPDAQPYHETFESKLKMCYLSRLAYPDLVALPKNRPRLASQGPIGPETLLFRTMTAKAWISARASNGELSRASGKTKYLHLVLRPALYLYSTLEPEVEMLGIAWVNSDVIYASIRDRTISACPDIDSRDIKIDKLCQPLLFAPRDVDSPPNDDARKAKIKEFIRKFGSSPDDTTHALPEDPALKAQLLASRLIEKVKIAFLSGPVNGDARSRRGVPMSFPYTTTRGFFRVLILRDCKLEDPDSGEFYHYYERLGTGELELSAVDKLEELGFEDVVLG